MFARRTAGGRLAFSEEAAGGFGIEFGTGFVIDSTLIALAFPFWRAAGRTTRATRQRRRLGLDEHAWTHDDRKESAETRARARGGQITAGHTSPIVGSSRALGLLHAARALVVHDR